MLMHFWFFRFQGRAGGLTALSKMPACNIQVLGAQKRNLSGFSNNASLPHTGYIYHSDFVQKLPPDLRTRAARLLANKVALAARVDSFHKSKVSWMLLPHNVSYLRADTYICPFSVFRMD